MRRPQLVIAPGKEKALQRRHPWLFSGAVKCVEGSPEEGDLVDLVDARGTWLATGHYQRDTIICKILSFDTPDIGDDFFLQRLRSAIGYRRSLGFFDYPGTPSDAVTDVFRLVHAEGDYLPGLVADWYGGTLVLQAHSVGMHRHFPLFADILRNLLGDSLKAIFDKSSATLPGGADDTFLWGTPQPEVEVTENGIRLIVNLLEGQKTGFFIDQRENRALVRSLASGRRVLNCFGYTGGFSLAALAGGASHVETVDISRRAVGLCQRNVALNFGPDAPHQGTVADVLQYIQTLKHSDTQAHRHPFDLIILDPPAFAKSHRHLQQGLRGYRAINQRAMEALPDGGLLMTFSCSQAVSTDDFRTMLFTAAMNAGRRVRIVRQLPHAADHPVSIHHPEGEYLKGLLLQVE